MTQVLENKLREMACDPTLTNVQRKHLTDAWNQIGFDRAEIDRLRRLLDDVAQSTFDGPMRAKINAALKSTT